MHLTILDSSCQLQSVASSNQVWPTSATTPEDHRRSLPGYIETTDNNMIHRLDQAHSIEAQNTERWNTLQVQIASTAELSVTAAALYS